MFGGFVTPRKIPRRVFGIDIWESQTALYNPTAATLYSSWQEGFSKKSAN